MEIWKSVIGFENSYEISSYGNVRSIDRYDAAGRYQRSQMMTLQVDKQGYFVINLRNDKKTFSKKIHQLVALAFLGSPNKPFGYKEGCVEINHKDGNKKNNKPNNLEYCTRLENIRHSYAIGLRKYSSVGQKNGRSKLNNNQVIEIRALYSTGNYSIPELGKKFHVGKSTVGYIVQGITWSHLLSQPSS